MTTPLLPTDIDAQPAPLVLLPGTLCDARLFAPLLDRLPQRESLFVALPHDDVHAAARHVLDRAPARFALLGFSLGGIVALRVAALAPERIFGLALIDSTARPVAPELHAGRRAAVASRAAAGPDHYVRTHLWQDYVAATALHDEALREVIVDMARVAGGPTLLRQTDLALSRPDSRPALAELAMPSLVLAGAEDALCPAEVQHEMAAALPDAVLAMIPGAGHFAPLERPEMVAAHVGAWLARVDDVARRNPTLVTHSLDQEAL